MKDTKTFFIIIAATSTAKGAKGTKRAVEAFIQVSIKTITLLIF